MYYAVRHDFQNALLHQVKRSYLKPCAHPWAALVLFDSLLVQMLCVNSSITHKLHILRACIVVLVEQYVIIVRPLLRRIVFYNRWLS